MDENQKNQAVSTFKSARESLIAALEPVNGVRQSESKPWDKSAGGSGERGVVRPQVHGWITGGMGEPDLVSFPPISPESEVVVF